MGFKYDYKCIRNWVSMTVNVSMSNGGSMIVSVSMSSGVSMNVI